MLKSTERPLRVLCYADMNAHVPYCVAAAEILRSQLGAQIMMMVYDRSLIFDEAFLNYELYDHKILFKSYGRYEPVEQVHLTAVKPPRAIGHPPVPSKLKMRNAGEGGDTSEDLREVVAATAPQVAANAREDKIAGNLPQPRIEFFGLRKFLARSRTLKGIYRSIRLMPYWALYFYYRFEALQLIARVIQAVRRGVHVRRFLRGMRPDLIILAEDNVERLSMTLINEGSRQGIPSVILPYTIPNPLEPAKSYRHRKIYQARGPLAWLVGKVLPKWQYQIDGKKLLRMPPSTALVLELIGQSSPAPWILNRGAAAKIALDSEAQRRTYLDLGFPKEQLSVVGDIHSGILHHGLMNKPRLLPELLARHDLRPGRPLILCAFPPDQYASKADEFEYRSYEDLIAGWVESFKALGDRANVLVRPHPRVPIKRFAAFEAPNVRFTAEPTVELVPLCDLYVASISATIRWALACGIPVINYDTYRYRYGDYDKAPGAIQTETLADFRMRLDRFVSDSAFAAETIRCQRDAKKDWGIIDDRLPERFAALVLELTGVAVQLTSN